MEVLEVTNLSKSYGKHLVIDGVSFMFSQPGIIALVGPNGVGKSTLMNILLNLIPYDEGQVRILGADHKDEKIFHSVSYLKDNTILYPYLTGWDHLSFAAAVYGLSKEGIDQVVDQLRIKDYVGKKTSSYSLGMKQMLLIALAILNDSQLIIMDEPLNGLDPSRIIEVRELLKILASQGKTILISSHTFLEVEEMTNYILFLKDGKIIEERLTSRDPRRLETKYREYYEL